MHMGKNHISLRSLKLSKSDSFRDLVPFKIISIIHNLNKHKFKKIKSLFYDTPFTYTYLKSAMKGDI